MGGAVKRIAAAVIVVALAACASVLGLHRAGPQPFPHGKHVRAGGTEQRARPHQRAPSVWHIRHGIAPSDTRLDHPGGCGLPPTPPTRWHCTHSASPAPP